MKCFVCVLGFIAVLVASADVDPGLRTTVSNAGLEYAKSVLQPILIEQVKTVSIPDMEDEVHSPVGKIKITLSNIRLNSFSLDSSSIVLSTPNVGTVSLKGIAVSLDMKWHYKAKFAKDSGSADVHTKGASTSVSAKIGRDPNTGAPVVTVSDTGFDCGELEIKLHGGASWLYNIFISCFKSKIRSAVNTQIRAKMTATIKEMIANALSSITLSYDLGNGISLCYALADMPLVIPDYGSRFVAGSVSEFYVTKEGRGKSPFKPSPMPKTTATSAPGPMLELFLNDYAINTLSYSFVHSGNTKMQIDASNAPEEAKPLLVSGYYVSAAPGLVKKYGTDAPLRLVFEVAQVPTLYMQPDGFELKTAGMLTMEVNESNTFTKVIDMNINMQIRGIVTVKGTSVIPHLDIINVTASIASSSVGEVDVKGMQNLIDFTTTYAVAEINDKLATGIPLPVVKGLSFVDPKIVWGANYAAIATSFSYKPQK